MKELSVFIDESGDFGDVKDRPAYYLVTFVFHDQDHAIEQQVIKLEESSYIRCLTLSMRVPFPA